MRGHILVFPLAASLLAPAQGQPAAAAEPPSFRSIELRGGGIVTVRHGPTRRVTASDDDPDRPILTDGDRLVIERCRGECRRGHRIEVEVVTPAISRLAVTDGGIVQLVGEFPGQAEIAASVSDGGTVDIRPVTAGSVSAAVSNGGRILARPGHAMAATVSDGGNVTYWGDAAVTSSVRRGGVVVRGAAADLHRPLALPGHAVPARPSGKE